MMEDIETLLMMDPLPDDAEDRLDALLDNLEPDLREIVEGGYQEALIVRRGEEGAAVALTG